jgi:hypothetical protein
MDESEGIHTSNSRGRALKRPIEKVGVSQRRPRDNHAWRGAWRDWEQSAQSMATLIENS